MVPPTALSVLVHESKPTQAQGTTKLNNNVCVKDNIIDVVEEDMHNMIVLEKNRIAKSDETLADTYG